MKAAEIRSAAIGAANTTKSERAQIEREILQNVSAHDAGAVRLLRVFLRELWEMYPAKESPAGNVVTSSDV